MRNQERRKLTLSKEEISEKKSLTPKANRYFKLFMVCVILQTIALSSFAQESTLIEVSGRVTDEVNQQPLPDISVQVKGTVTGTVTNKTGEFKLRTKTKLPFTLAFSSIGFKEQQFEVTSLGSNLQIALSTQTILGSDVVVTASRVEESIQKSPVAIEKLNIRALKETPAASFYDALGNMKGVQLTTSSITFKVPNTRGFF